MQNTKKKKKQVKVPFLVCLSQFINLIMLNKIHCSRASKK